MATVNRQIQAAAERMAPQIYNAVVLHPDPAGRAKLLRVVLVGVDPALSDRVARSVEVLLARGAQSQAAVLRAITVELARLMTEQAAAIGGLEGCCCQEMSGLGTPPSPAQLTAISGMITGIGRTVNTLATTAGNIAVSAVQTRRGQPVTGLPGMPVAAAAPAAPLGPADLGPYGQPVQGPASPPWGWIIGGVAAVGALGAVWYFTQKKPKPAAAAAAA
jgi:hypothetical protein